MAAAYAALTSALEQLKEAGRDPVRDSDVKRKILDADRTFDEGALGFPKFSKFLEQASEDGVITLRREGRVTEVSLPAEGSAPTATASADPVSSDATESPSGDDGADDHGGPADGKATVIEVEPPKRGLFGLRLGPRRGATRRRGGDGASLFGFGGTSADSASEGESDDDSSASIGTGVAAQELAALEAASTFWKFPSTAGYPISSFKRTNWRKL